MQVFNNLFAYQFPGLSNSERMNHFITGRRGGKSIAEYQSFNLSYKVGDNSANVLANRSNLLQTLNIPGLKLLIPDQCHTSNIKLVDKFTSNEDLLNTDGLITTETEVCIAVLAADCVPVLLYDPVQRVIAVLHAGWRGTIENITGKAIDLMQRNWGSAPENILAGIGPSISWQRYEVGSEVVEKFQSIFKNDSLVIREIAGSEKKHIDLWQTNKQLLMNAGLLQKHIEIAGICTYDNPGNYFSARRDGINSGRFASGIILLK